MDLRNSMLCFVVLQIKIRNHLFGKTGVSDINGIWYFAKAIHDHASNTLLSTHDFVVIPLIRMTVCLIRIRKQLVDDNLLDVTCVVIGLRFASLVVIVCMNDGSHHE